MQPQDFPLMWPKDRPRTSPESRVVGKFTITFENAYDALIHEAEKLHDAECEVIISTNIPLDKEGMPLVSASKHLGDPGVAVYVWREGKPYAMSCDTYQSVRHNLRALWATIQALRTIQRHATGALLAQSMSGFAREVTAGERVDVKMIAANGG